MGIPALKGMGLTTCSYEKYFIFLLSIMMVTLYTTEENEVIKRLAAVFEQSYTRFLDLQKAEAQARESQIEAGIGKSSCKNNGDAKK